MHADHGRRDSPRRVDPLVFFCLRCRSWVASSRWRPPVRQALIISTYIYFPLNSSRRHPLLELFSGITPSTGSLTFLPGNSRCAATGLTNCFYLFFIFPKQGRPAVQQAPAALPVQHRDLWCRPASGCQGACPQPPDVDISYIRAPEHLPNFLPTILTSCFIFLC